MCHLCLQSSPNLRLICKFTKVSSINIHKRSRLTNTFNSCSIDPERINIRCTHHIHFAYHLAFEQVLQEVIVNLFHSIFLEEFILKFAGSLRVVENVLDVVFAAICIARCKIVCVLFLEFLSWCEPSDLSANH